MSDRLFVATRKGLFTVERRLNSRTWEVGRTSFLGVPVSSVLQDRRDGAIYAALDHGHFGTKLHRSRDGGKSFEECGVPAYPEKPADEVDDDPNTGRPRAWKLRLVWSLEAGHRSEPGMLWCGTLPGGLFRSADAGSTWSLVRSLWDDPRRKQWAGGGAQDPGIHSICVHPKQKGHVTVGVSCGGVWVTEDGGSRWELRAQGMVAAYMPPDRAGDPVIQDPHRVVQCRARPESLWAQHHNGVFRTVDGGRTWTEVQGLRPSAFGFAVAVHPRDPETAWFVPAVKDDLRIPAGGQVTVTRTRDGGQTCEILRRGLPQAHAYDLVWRHALDIDESGRRLAFGSTTGNLWISLNQGDSWLCVSNHLPPIAAVRFAV